MGSFKLGSIIICLFPNHEVILALPMNNILG